MATFVVLIHPVTILVSVLATLKNLTNDHLIFNSVMKVDCDTVVYIVPDPYPPQTEDRH